MELAEWWEKFSTAYDDERHEMIEAVRQAQSQKPQSARVRVKRAEPDVRFAVTGQNAGGADAQAEFSSEQADGANHEAGAPAKKRRRRRKPGGRSGEGLGGSDQSPPDLSNP